MPAHEPFAVQLRRLREARGLSRETLAHRTAGRQPGVSAASITTLELRSERRPTDETILLLGQALEATDEEFPAYALARARALFDEHRQDPAVALRNLRRLRDCFGS